MNLFRISDFELRNWLRQEDRLLYADGAPCTSSYQDMTPLLEELDQRAGTSPELR